MHDFHARSRGAIFVIAVAPDQRMCGVDPGVGAGCVAFARPRPGPSRMIRLTDMKTSPNQPLEPTETSTCRGSNMKGAPRVVSCLRGSAHRSARFPHMRVTPLLAALAILAGCASDDARLHGTWRSNREATVAALQQNPSLTNVPPARIERLKELYGHLTWTYSNGVAVSSFHGAREMWRYRIIDRGADFVVIRMKGMPDLWIRFVDGGKAYWVGGVAEYEERFDKVQ
jgi:hypothetical protein